MEKADQIKLIKVAKEYAIKCHKDTNHLYDGQPYELHLYQVIDVAKMYGHELIHADKIGIVLAACWAHDTIEDTRQTYNDVKEVLGEEVAEIVYALTNDKGKNRKERAGAKYYQGIRNTQFASFVKVCDRIANVQYSKITGNGMFEKYKKENAIFINELYTRENDKIFAHLNNLFN